MKLRKSPKEMAQILGGFYEKKFGGKKRGRFQISRASFRQLAGSKILRESYVEKVGDECLDLGYILIQIGDIFAVIEEKVVMNYRNVPQKVIQTIFSEEGESEDVPGDDH